MPQLLPWLLPHLQEYIYLHTGLNWGERERAPSSEFNGDFFMLLRRRSRLGMSCAWVRVVSAYELCLRTYGVWVRTSYASVAYTRAHAQQSQWHFAEKWNCECLAKSMSAALQRRRQQQRARRASERPNGGWQEQESCGYTTHGTGTVRRGLLVPFNDLSEYETTRTLARTSLALAPTMVYIHLVLYYCVHCEHSYCHHVVYLFCYITVVCTCTCDEGPTW